MFICCFDDVWCEFEFVECCDIVGDCDFFFIGCN